MSKRKKKEAVARMSILVVVAICLILFAIFGILIIGKLSEEPIDDPIVDPVLGTSGDDTEQNDHGVTLSPDEVDTTVGRLLYEMQSNDIITLCYEQSGIDITAADVGGSYDIARLKTYVQSKGYSSSIVDSYIANGNDPASRPIDMDYVRGAVYTLSDMIHSDMDQGYVIDGAVVTIYKSDEIVTVNTEETCNSILRAVENGEFGKVDAIVTVDKSGEPDWEEIALRVNVDPKNAEYVYNEETKRAELVPEESGFVLDMDAVRSEYANSTDPVLTFYVEEVKPEITVENIEEKMFYDKLTYYTTWYNVNEENRTNNLELAAAAINGEVILPGKRFSFNTVVGERTPERGYKKATIYTSDGMTDDYGGGICQVVSTLYCALLYEDFDIVRRTEHGYTVSYVDLGKDATVSYGWIDFVFENNFDNPVMIKAYTSGGYLYVDIMGIRVDTIDVTIRHETIEEIEPVIKIKKDETLEPEEYKLISKGKKGYVIETYMKVVKNGEYLGERLLHTSKYDALDGEARVGVNWTESTEGVETTLNPAETTVDTSETTNTSAVTTASPDVTSSDSSDQTEAPPETEESTSDTTVASE